MLPSVVSLHGIFVIWIFLMGSINFRLDCKIGSSQPSLCRYDMEAFVYNFSSNEGKTVPLLSWIKSCDSQIHSSCDSGTLGNLLKSTNGALLWSSLLKNFQKLCFMLPYLARYTSPASVLNGFLLVASKPDMPSFPPCEPLTLARCCDTL